MTHLQKTGTGFLVRVFGTGFWCVCHWHKSSCRSVHAPKPNSMMDNIQVWYKWSWSRDCCQTQVHRLHVSAGNANPSKNIWLTPACGRLNRAQILCKFGYFLHRLTTNLLISPLLGLHLNLKFQRSFSVVPTSNVTLILSQPGSWKNVLQFSFLQLPTSSICLSAPVTSIPFSNNLSYLPFWRNPP